jgi:hypothetical protein
MSKRKSLTLKVMRGTPMSKRKALTLKGKRRDERGRVLTMKGRVPKASSSIPKYRWIQEVKSKATSYLEGKTYSNQEQ